ncbi:MAG: AI-2E family transporter [Lachnospiraceae bacterium]|nr:AI-2E family transporter [Lachnospiraceae bacterium]
MKKWFQKNLRRNWLSLTVAICIGVVLFVFLSHLGDVGRAIAWLWNLFSPIILGFCIAYVLNPIAGGFDRTIFKRIRRRNVAWLLSVALTIIVVLALFAILMVFLIPQLIDSIRGFIANLGNYMDALTRFGIAIRSRIPNLNIDFTEIDELVTNFGQRIVYYITEHQGELFSALTGAGQTLFYLLISFVIAVYVLADKVRVIGWIKRLVKVLTKDENHNAIRQFWNRCNQIIRRFIIVDFIEALLVGLLNALLMRIFGMNYIVIVSMVVGVTNLFPTFGPIVGAAVGALILLLVNPLHALIFLIFTVLLQFADGYIVKPKLYGNTLHVSGLWVLIMLIVWGRMIGVVGVFLAIPIGAILDFLYRDYIYPKLAKRKEQRIAREEAEAAEAAEAAEEAETAAEEAKNAAEEARNAAEAAEAAAEIVAEAAGTVPDADGGSDPK